MIIFSDIEKYILQRHCRDHNNPEEENKQRGSCFLDFKTYYKIYSNQSSVVLTKK